MHYVSCRNHFKDVDGVPVDNSGWFGSATPTPSQSELVLVHGYNGEADAVMDAYRASSEISKECGVSIPLTGYLWPGLGGNWLESIEFHKAQAQADKSAAKFAEYVNAGPPAMVMTHSLGAKVVLEAMVKHGAKVKQLFLTGPAVAWDCFATDYKAATESCKIHVFWSLRDNVLGRAFMIDQFTKALGHSGPKAPFQSSIISTDVTDQVGAHGQYRFDRNIWRVIAASTTEKEK